MSHQMHAAIRPPRPVLGPARAALAALVLGLAAALALLPTSGADARLVWCAGDPVIEINGEHRVSVTVNVPEEDLDQVDHASVVFHVPANVDAEVIFIDDTYFDETAEVVFDQPAWDGDSPLKIRVDVTVVTTDGSDFNVGASTLDARGNATWNGGRADRPFTVPTFAVLGR